MTNATQTQAAPAIMGDLIYSLENVACSFSTVASLVTVLNHSNQALHKVPSKEAENAYHNTVLVINEMLQKANGQLAELIKDFSDDEA